MKVEEIETSRIIPYANNPRHNDQAVSAVAASIKEFGFRQPIVTDETMTILVGHTRLKAAQNLGLSVVPVHIAEGLTEAQKKAYRIADNRLNELAEWDEELLSLELEALTDADFDLGLLGFDADELEELLEGNAGTEGNTDPDDVPEAPVNPVTKLGDVWLLGEHRVMCGDSSHVATVGRLMGGCKADMVFTDPPYNIGSENKGIAANVSKAHKELMAADWDKNFDIEAPLNCVLSVLAEDCVVYVCTSHHLAGRIWAWMKEWAEHYLYCVWSKPDPMPSLMKRHWTWDTELIAYATRGKHIFNAEEGSHSPSTWRINKQQGLERTGHPTQKPVAVPQHAIEKSSRANQIVLDLFGGSGSTLVACEKLGRECRMMELDPKYCDVIIKRWQAFTGKKAILERTGEEFDTLCASISEETVIK